MRRVAADVLKQSTTALLVSGLIVAGFPPLRLEAGDILRGGATAGSARRNAEARSNVGSEAAAASQQRAQDRLARTTQVVNDMRKLQADARAAAGAGDVPDGLQPGGLERLTGVNAKWTGASAPVASGNNVIITQNQQQALLHWKTFNVGKNTTLQFDQSAGGTDSGKWIAFNKVFDPSGQPSKILGSIKADGQVYVINQNGILFGAGSQVNARSLVASALPINDTLIERGLLNQPAKDVQFLFSAGSGTAGNIQVDAGARIDIPERDDGNGGRIILAGKNVSNAGTLSTPAGQTILASGLEIGLAAHDTSDASLRGLDVYIGATGDGGVTTNTGLIEIPRGSTWMAGRTLNQNGVIDSTTSVSLNGRIDLRADYDAIPNPVYDPTVASTGLPFLARSTGLVRLGEGAIMRIIPESTSEKRTGTSLALRSQINVQGKSIYASSGSSLLAPNAKVNLRAGNWLFALSGSQPTSTFAATGGQVYLDSGSLLDVSGTTGVEIPMDQNILEVELRGSELADSPLQRNGAIRGIKITIDARRTGTYNGKSWVGTPLGDASGYVGLIQRTAGQLTTAGGSVTISAGESVVVREGASIDVSGGWVRNLGGRVQTTRLVRSGNIVDIADATPDVLYDGLYSSVSKTTHTKWGVTKSFSKPLSPDGAYTQKSYIQGADAGDISLTAPTLVVDGSLSGRSIIGPRQLRSSAMASSLPRSAGLEVAFRGQDSTAPSPLTTYYPTQVVVASGTTGGVAAFSADTQGNAAAVDDARRGSFRLDPGLTEESGFGRISVLNEEGAITVPQGVSLKTVAGGSIRFSAAKIDVQGAVVSPGGSISLTAYNISPYQAALIGASANPLTPPANPGLGVFALGDRALVSAAGTVVDDRPLGEFQAPAPHARNGGNVTITAFDVNLAAGGVIDASGGVSISPSGSKTYGDGGSISIRAGQDPGVSSVFGGKLVLNSELRGYAGGKPGALTLQSSFVEVGDSPSQPDSLSLSPEFFNRGGFGSFTVIGIGAPLADPQTPAVSIAPGVIIRPVATSLALAPPSSEGARFVHVQKAVGERTPVSLSFQAPGVFDAYSNGLVRRGDLVMGEGSQILTDPKARVVLAGNTVTVLGSIEAPAGEIQITGGSDSTKLFTDQSAALVTTYIGPRARLSTAGAFVPSSDPYRRNLGEVLAGGRIRVSGNIYAAPGSVLDVSGASAWVDLPPGSADIAASRQVPANSGLTRLPDGLRVQPTLVSSDGGTITLQGGQLLRSAAQLIGNPGSESSAGGTLIVSSGRFYPVGAVSTPIDTNLTVYQSSTASRATTAAAGISAIGRSITDANGVVANAGAFDVDQFQSGGFDSLELKGIVRFSGPVQIHARRSLAVADSGVVSADSDVDLSAPYVVLGLPFSTPELPGTRTSPFATPVLASSGTGSLHVSGRLIDIGTLSLQQIGSATISARDGDIRGSGTFNIAGDLTLEAGQIYPTTASTFRIIASDVTSGASTRPGSVTIIASGSRKLPMSAGGGLEIFASRIDQRGVLRAPFGSIVLGWDGRGTAPVNLLSGASVPVAQSVRLAGGSVTSVSALDSATGEGLVIPYGVSVDGNSWIDPRGVDVTTSGLTSKTVTISSANLTTEDGSLVDLRGGGDLLAYRWVEGKGGRKDILSSDSSFVILPGSGYDFAPYSPFNSSASDENLISDSGAGYVNSNLRAGDSIYVSGSKSLSAGYYTLLPARYGTLPGAVLVTPASGASRGVVETAEGASLVSGFRYNALDASKSPYGKLQRFELLTGSALSGRAEYQTYSANSFIAERAATLGVSTQKLPQDAGYLLLQATRSLNLGGMVAAGATGEGRGGGVDIDTPLDIVISTSSTPVPGKAVLNSGLLSRWNAESLLVGGRRYSGATSTAVSVSSGSITVDNAGAPLSGYEIILVANNDLTIAPGAQIIQTGSDQGAMENLVITGRRSLSTSSALTVSRGGGSLLFQEGLPGGGRIVSSVAGKIIASDGTSTDFTASAPVSVAAGSRVVLSAAGTVSLTGVSSGDSVSVVTGDGALLRVTGDSSATQTRSALSYSTQPSLRVGGGARISGTSVTLDSSAGMTIDPAASLAASNFSIGAGKVNIDLDGSSAMSSSSDLLLKGGVLNDLLRASTLAIRSYSSLDFYGSGALGSSALAKLTLSAGQVNNAGAGSVRVLAGRLELNNANAADSSVSALSSAGSLSLEADEIVFGNNAVAINRFGSVTATAARSISGEGAGSLTSQTSLTLVTPLLTGAAGSDRSISAAGGALSILKNATSPASVDGTSLGATLSLTGSSVDLASDIILRSGLVSVRAVSGPLTVSGKIDVSGTSQTFYDVVRYTDAGEVRLSADAGSINLTGTSLVDVSGANFGNAGTLAISAPKGLFVAAGALDASASAAYRTGSFSLDILSLPDLSVYSGILTAAQFSESQSFRVRGNALVAGSGDVLIKGTSTARAFNLSTDLGNITVGNLSGAGIINASGATGGSISLMARGDVTISSGSLLSVRGRDFSSSGKGGTINLEAGTQSGGGVGTGRVRIQSGSTLDLGVDSRVVLNANPATDAITLGSSAYQGRFSGKLAIRASQNNAGTDVLVDAIDGTIRDASSITVEGYRIFDLTNTGGLITNSGTLNALGGLMTSAQNVQGSIRQSGVNFLGSSGSASAGYTAMLNRLLANNAGLASAFVLTPGAEIINRNGDLTLGSISSTTTSDWNFITNSAATTFRFGPKSAPGVLTMRATGNLVFFNALSDGFTPTLASSDATWLWLARLSNQNTNLPVNTQSWTFRMAAGADLSAADYHRVMPLSSLSSTAGFLKLGKNNGLNIVANVTDSSSAQTASAISNRFQVIRTGTGDIDISTGRSIQILNHFSTIYTAGARVTNPTLNSTFDTPTLLQNDQSGTSSLGSPQQFYPALYSMAGGDVLLSAQENIERLTVINGQTVADSQFQMPNNWLYRRGYVGADGSFAQLNIGNILTFASTTWWIDFSNFFQGIGALGGGDVTLQAGGSVSNVDAVIPTNARMAKGVPDSAKLLELGGGDLTVRAGSDIDAGVYYVERGLGILSAGRSIKTNSTREVTNGSSVVGGLTDSATWLPTTLFLGRGGFDVSARNNVILGPVANTFLLPGGLGNTYRYKTYFTTYDSSSYVNISSIGGDVILRNEAAIGGSISPVLQQWFQNKLLWTPATSSSTSFARPWLRLNESNVQFFGTVSSLRPPTLRATAFSSGIKLAGDLTLFPSSTGTLELLARTSLDGLSSMSSSGTNVAGYSIVNVSDASPSAVPGVASPFAYQKIADIVGSPSSTTDQNFLKFLDDMFIESGATAGTEASLEARLARHSSSILHASDTSPLRLYSTRGDISGLTLFSPKAARILAGRDISDVALYIQNVVKDDITVVGAARDILAYNASSLLRTSLSGVPTVALAGDIQAAGPGTLEVLAGRNLDLGTGASLSLSWKVESADGNSNVIVTANTAKQALAQVQALVDSRGNQRYPWSASGASISLLTVSDGLGTGITTVGNARNPFVANTGATIVAAAGLGSSSGLSQSSLDFTSLWTSAATGSNESRAIASLPDFFNLLRDAGRAAAMGGAGGYASGFDAIAALFPGTYSGDVLTRSRDIRTKSGGDIFLLIPGGGLTLSNTSIYETSAPPGIITESGGNISIFANKSVDIGIGRIFTLRGGNEIIWSSTGDIAAGASSKTVASAPPTRVLLDPQSAALQTDLAGLATGGGIGVLATVAGVAPGDVDLIAPAGVVDAGDAGIRVTGNLNIAATRVLNAGNISAGGTTTGVPSAPVVAAPNIGGLTSASSTTGAASAAAEAMASQATSQNQPEPEIPSLIMVEVLGYGGGDEP